MSVSFLLCMRNLGIGEKLNVFLCTHVREDNRVACGQTLSPEEFRDFKLDCFRKFGHKLKLVSTNCQGVCPYNECVGTIVYNKEDANGVLRRPEQLSFENTQEIYTVIQDRLSHFK